jgi:predicted anti-sigma-YlaC factor YlaD
MDALDGTLAAPDRQRLMAHLDTCPQCRADWEALSALEQLLSRPRVVQPAPGFAIRVEARLTRIENQRRTLVGGLILLGAAVVFSLLALPSLLNGRNPIEAYVAFLSDTYGLLGYGLSLSYQLASTLWIILSALSSSVDISLANLLTYGAAIALAMIAWRRALISQTTRVQPMHNGH